MNNRRKLIVALGAGGLVASFGSSAQQPPTRIPRIGLLSPFTANDTAVWHRAFHQGLRDLGWFDGKNIGIEFRYADGRDDRLPDLAADLVRLKVDVIVAAVTADVSAAKNATKTIPIVMQSAGDPVALGLVASLARPGGNVTGLTNISTEMGGKRLALLKELVPNLSRVAVLWNPQTKISTLNWKDIQLPAQQLGIQVHSLQAQSPSDFDKVFKDATQARAGALAVLPDPLFAGNIKRIADLAIKHHLPSIFHLKEYVDVGGLAAYGPDRSDLFRRSATYVDKILRGAKPADLPVEQPTKFELFLNGRTAKVLRLIIPQSLLVIADKVSE